MLHYLTWRQPWFKKENNKSQIFPTHLLYPLCLEPTVSVLAEEQWIKRPITETMKRMRQSDLVTQLLVQSSKANSSYLVDWGRKVLSSRSAWGTYKQDLSSTHLPSQSSHPTQPCVITTRNGQGTTLSRKLWSVQTSAASQKAHIWTTASSTRIQGYIA